MIPRCTWDVSSILTSGGTVHDVTCRGLGGGGRGYYGWFLEVGEIMQVKRTYKRHGRYRGAHGFNFDGSQIAPAAGRPAPAPGGAGLRLAPRAAPMAAPRGARGGRAVCSIRLYNA